MYVSLMNDVCVIVKPIGSGKPNPICESNFPLVWITSTNDASDLCSFIVKLTSLKQGCAGSNPVILSIFHLLCLFFSSFAANPQMCAPRLWPTKCNGPQSFSCVFVVAFHICSRNLYNRLNEFSQST